jgi:hypothetical protein
MNGAIVRLCSPASRALKFSLRSKIRPLCCADRFSLNIGSIAKLLDSGLLIAAGFLV